MRAVGGGVAYFLEGVTGVRIFQASGSSASPSGQVFGERGGEGGGAGGEEVFCSVVLFRYEANSFFWSWKLLRSSLFPETRDGLLTGYSEACLKRSFFFTG